MNLPQLLLLGILAITCAIRKALLKRGFEQPTAEAPLFIFIGFLIALL